jgi:hypothetical protein
MTFAMFNSDIRSRDNPYTLVPLMVLRVSVYTHGRTVFIFSQQTQSGRACERKLEVPLMVCSNSVKIGWKTKILSFRVSFNPLFGNSPSVLVGRVNSYLVFKFCADRMKN